MAIILLLDPDRDRAAGIRSLLRQDGHQVHLQKSIDDWRETERQLAPEVVIAPADCSDSVLVTPDRPIRGFPAPLLFIQHDEQFDRSIHLNSVTPSSISSQAPRTT